MCAGESPSTALSVRTGILKHLRIRGGWCGLSLSVLLTAERLNYEFYDSVRCVSYATRCQCMDEVFVFDQKHGNKPNARKNKKKVEQKEKSTKIYFVPKSIRRLNYSQEQTSSTCRLSKLKNLEELVCFLVDFKILVNNKILITSCQQTTASLKQASGFCRCEKVTLVSTLHLRKYLEYIQK